MLLDLPRGLGPRYDGGHGGVVQDKPQRCGGRAPAMLPAKLQISVDLGTQFNQALWSQEVPAHIMGLEAGVLKLAGEQGRSQRDTGNDSVTAALSQGEQPRSRLLIQDIKKHLQRRAEFLPDNLFAFLGM